MMKLTLGKVYSRLSIHQALGGDMQSYLPQLDGRIVCGCFNVLLNPNAPEAILVGSGPIVINKAEILVSQGGSIPVFLKQERNRWKYIGQYLVLEPTTDLDEIKARTNSSGRRDISMVLNLARVRDP